MKQLKDYKKFVNYSDISKAGIDMRINHPHFTHFPMLQDAVMAFLEDLPQVEQQKILDDYKQPDLGWLHISLISFKSWIDLAIKLENYNSLSK